VSLGAITVEPVVADAHEARAGESASENRSA
jgi:hypothetical protein